jgi:hypothetical protein
MSRLWGELASVESVGSPARDRLEGPSYARDVTAFRSFRIPAAALAAAAVAASIASTSGASSFAPPKKLGALARFGDLKINQSSRGQALAKRHNAWNQKTAAAASAAYGGAAAIAQDYANDGLTDFALLVAVKGPTPKLYVPYNDAKYLGLARAPQEVRVYGDVQCIVHNDPTVTGRKPAPDSVHVGLCQRSGPHLTVQVQGVGGQLGNHPETVAQLIDQEFAALS